MHSSAGPENVLLVGPPNSGKTTLFNWLTRSRYRAVNYPGSTVDCLRGQSHPSYGRIFGVIDSPGIYGLHADSQDEEITIRLIHFDSSMGPLEAAIVCVDSTQLERHLPLVVKLQHLGWPLVVALTMHDLGRLSGHDIDRVALEEVLKIPVVEINGRTGSGVSDLVDRVLKLPSRAGPHPKKPPLDDFAVAETVQSWMKQIRRIATSTQTPQQKSARLDQFLLHPVFGILGFLLVMVGLFTAVFWLADPLMGAVDSGFSALGEFLRARLSEGAWTDFLLDGVLTSFASVLVFAPQILILFFLLSLLEDSGYLARAATLIDRPLSMVGLSGRAFVPLLSGYACAVPAIMAVRSIRSTRERWLAIAIIPLLSCSARLPVFALLLAFVLRGRPAWQGGVALTAIYLGSALMGALAAAFLNQFLKKSGPTTFLMELPLYRRPQAWLALRHSLTRTHAYVRRAGPVIFVLALVVWAGTRFPSPEPNESYMGQLGQALEPAFRPMGVDWRVGVGLLSAFAAREVFVSALSLVFDSPSPVDESGGIRESILSSMSSAHFPDGTPIFTTASVLGLIVFFMLALQCSSTVAIVARETGQWKFALFQLLVLNGLAYAAAVLTVQLVRLLGGMG